MKINKVTIEMLRIHPDDRRMVFTIEDDEGRKLSYTEMLWESDAIDVMKTIFRNASQFFHEEYDPEKDKRGRLL
jgi:hypothetical protein